MQEILSPAWHPELCIWVWLHFVLLRSSSRIRTKFLEKQGTRLAFSIAFRHALRNCGIEYVFRCFVHALHGNP